ncbi:hypothetical protein OKW30_002560 [Paraburkholderia sp. Clong3]|uniref:hypothetical protein n=1 Tax=Paraburkholderia sp. Clong3 TaxID=2991061 RepID=UPI003D251F79
MAIFGGKNVPHSTPDSRPASTVDTPAIDATPMASEPAPTLNDANLSGATVRATSSVDVQNASAAPSRPESSDVTISNASTALPARGVDQSREDSASSPPIADAMAARGLPDVRDREHH